MLFFDFVESVLRLFAAFSIGAIDDQNAVEMVYLMHHLTGRIAL